jgi:hypothetical protein
LNILHFVTNHSELRAFDSKIGRAESTVIISS